MLWKQEENSDVNVIYDIKSWENKMSNPAISDISVNATPKKYVSPILYLPGIFVARQKKERGSRLWGSPETIKRSGAQ